MTSFLVLALSLPAAPPPAGETDKLDPALLERAIDAWGKRLVPVELWLRRSEGERPSLSPMNRGNLFNPGGPFLAGVQLQTSYEEKRPVEVSGLAVDARTVWIPDLGFERRFLARATVGSPPRAAALRGAVLGAPLWVISPETPLEGLGVIEWKAAGAGTEDLLLLSAQPGRGGWILSLSPLGSALRSHGTSVWLETGRGALVISRDLAAAGYSSSGRLGLESAPDIWRGPDLFRSAVIDLETLGKEELSKALGGPALTVRGFFRREEEAEDMFPRRFRFRGEEGPRRNEFLATGYAVGRNRVLVNQPLSREAAFRLSRIQVLVSGEPRSARFLGVLRGYHAFLVEVEGDPLPDVLDLASPARFELSQPLLGFTADHDSGKRREMVELHRIADFERGYKGVVEPVLQRFPRPATLFYGVEDHRFRGAVIEVYRESDDEEAHRSFRGGMSSFYSMVDSGGSRAGVDLRLITPAELRKLAEAGPADFDARFAPRGAEREKDVVWLGAEFQPLNRELARSQSVEVPTRGGDVGVLVLKVHSRSPAERAGIAPGDVLLTLRAEDEEEPWEIHGGGDFGREEFLEDGGDEAPEEMMTAMGPPWRPTRNVLTEKLTRIGEGRKVEISYYREGVEKRATITTETAPPDFESARKLKSEELGLTVKDLTYEVRSHYRLADDAPGVVIAKIEPGGRAQVAKVVPFEILVSVNGKPVRNVEEFQRQVDEAVKPPAGEKVLELRLERMGKSRLLRIRL